MAEKQKTKFKDLPLWKRIVTIVVDVIVGVFAVFAIASVVIAVSFKVNNSNGTLTFGNTEVRLVQTGSMEWGGEVSPKAKGYLIGEIKTYDAVYINKKPTTDEGQKLFYDNLKEGDVVSFWTVREGTKVNITHRIVGKTVQGNGYMFTIQGDNWTGGEPACDYIYTCTDSPIPSQYIMNEFNGIVFKTSSFVGGFFHFVQSKTAIICLVIVPCVLIIGYEVVKIILIVNKDKKKKKLVIKSTGNTEDEIEKLKKMLAEKEAELKNEKSENKDE